MLPERPHPQCRFCFRHPWLRSLRRRWPLWLAVIGILLLVASRFVEIKQLARTLSEGQWQWMLAAGGLQGIYYALYAMLYQASFATVGVESRARALLPVLFASMFIGTVMPTGSLGAAALVINDAARRKQSPARAAEGVLLVWVSGVGTVWPVLLLGLGYLYGQRALQAYEIIVALIFFLYVSALIGALLLAKWQPGRMRHILRWAQRTVNALLSRLHRPPALPDDWAVRNATESAGAAIAIASRPRQLACTLAVALAAHLVNLASLHAIFLGFRDAVPLGALAAAYGIGFVVSVISILPFDLGAVAGVMTLVYTSLGVPAARALLIALSFRGLNAYLPVVLGFFAFRWMKPKDS